MSVVSLPDVCLGQTVVHMGEKPQQCHHALLLPYAPHVSEQSHVYTLQEWQKLREDGASWRKSLKSLFTGQELGQYSITLHSHLHRQVHTVHLLIPRLSQLLSAVHCKAVCNEKTTNKQLNLWTKTCHLVSLHSSHDFKVTHLLHCSKQLKTKHQNAAENHTKLHSKIGSINKLLHLLTEIIYHSQHTVTSQIEWGPLYFLMLFAVQVNHRSYTNTNEANWKLTPCLLVGLTNST